MHICSVLFGFKLNVPLVSSLYVVTGSLKCAKGGKKKGHFFFQLAAPSSWLWGLGKFSFNLAVVVLWELHFMDIWDLAANFNDALFYSPALLTVTGFTETGGRDFLTLHEQRAPE